MMASVVVGGNRRKSLTLRGVDPETCMIVFKNHWAQVVKILEKHEPARSAPPRLGVIPADEASAVQNYVEHMLFLLMEEEAGQAMGPILEFVVVEGVMERLFLWSLRRQFTEDMKLEQLRMYQMLLSQARQPLLHHKPVLRPLMMLLASCSGGVVEAELVLLLHQLCAALVKDPSVLELFFHTSEDQGAANFLLFSLLIPYTHRQGSVGQQAREALLLIMSLSASEPRVAQHIADNTYFCPVLATGLSGLYSSLPARLQVYSEDWHFLDQADWQQVPALVHFLHSLDFCSAVTKVAHPSIRLQLLGYIYNGFLVPVLAPALHKVLTVEEVMTTTAYLDLFLRSIAEPALLQTFLSFILLHTHDNVHILDTLVSRVNTPFQLGTVSLALFRTLIGLFCEDVMLQLVFRYLIPCSHLSRRQRCSLDQTHCLSSCAASFLLLTPSWCPLHLPHTHTEHIHWPQGAGQWETHTPSFSQICFNFLMDVNYLHYLWDDEMADDIEQQDKSNSVCSVCPTSTLSSTSSISDTVSTGNQAGRAGSVLELEWDDMFLDDDAASSTATTAVLTNVPPLLPPQHIQEMRRNATMLVHGLYVEETEFQDDVLVYDLVAQKDAKVAMLDRMAAREQNGKQSLANGFSDKKDIISECDYSEEEEEEKTNCELTSDDKPCTQNCNLNVLNANNHHTHTQHHNTHRHDLPNGHAEFESHEPSVTDNFLPVTEATNGDDFLSQYRELMLSLGVEPDGEEITDIGSFRRRIRALRERQEEEGLGDKVYFNWLWDDGEDDGEEVVLEEEEEEEGETGRSSRRKSSRKREFPFTGPFISVLLSRLENLLENSIAVNLLVTGILAQLASYPQPLLKLFLLNTHTHYQPTVRTLYQVTHTHTHTHTDSNIDIYFIYVCFDFQCLRQLNDMMCVFLLVVIPAVVIPFSLSSCFPECLQSQDDDITVGGPLPNGSLSPPPLGATPPCPPIPPQARSRVFAIVLYAEFLKELAAIAQEHSIAPDGAAEE
uniref:Family with sequence similarity 160 member A1b n=1 Tax=Myripristis murdjan TaxID=586833 RepID=A0A667YU55_9TELE